MNLFVARLSYGTTDEGLLQAFEAYGEVSSARVIMDRETGQSRGFGFVEMPNQEEAIQAMSELNEAELDGRYIIVKEANEAERGPRNNDRSSFRGGNGGGGFNRDNNRRFEGRDNNRRGGGGGDRRDNRGGGDRDGGRRYERRSAFRPNDGEYDSED